MHFPIVLAFLLPIVALVDTSADPDLITVPVASNDDAIRAVELMTASIADAIIDARREAPVRTEVEETESYTYSSDRGAEPEAGDERRRRRRPRRRRANQEAIAARLKAGPGAEGDAAATDDGGDAGDAGAEPAAE